MKLDKILKEEQGISVYGKCRKCGYAGQAKGISTGEHTQPIFACPKCRSINFRIDKVTKPANSIFEQVLYERK